MESRFKTWLPVFSGFYNTVFSGDNDIENELESINEDREYKISYDNLEIDFKGYQNSVGIECTKFIEGKLKELGIINSLLFENVYSPNFYNYSNDSINIEVEINIVVFSEYLNSNIEKLGEYIKGKYTSYSGFSSFYSNDINEWVKETNNFSEFTDECRVGSLLDFICINEGISEEDMYEDTCDKYIMNIKVIE